MQNEEMICAIADGSMSASRVKRLVKAIYGADVETKEVVQVCADRGIALIRKQHPRFTVEVLYESREYNVVWFHEVPAPEGGYMGYPQQIDTITSVTAREALNLWAEKNPDDTILLALKNPYIKKTHCRLEAFPSEGSTPKNIKPGVGIVTDDTEVPTVVGTKIWKHLDSDRKVEISPTEYAIELSKIDLPDRWSLFLAYKSDWVRVRRYWGDKAASSLKSAIESANELNFEWIYSQIANYINPHICDRADIQFCTPVDWKPRSSEDLLKEFELSGCQRQDIGKGLGVLLRFPWSLKAQLYLDAYAREFEDSPQFQEGAKYPLPTTEWHEFKERKYREDCLAVAPEEKDLVEFFAKFWQEVYSERGEAFYKNLKSDLVGASEYNRPFYSASQKHFEHFLANLNGFRTRASWRIPLYAGSHHLSMYLQGALIKYGWRKVRDLAVFALIVG